MHYLCVAGQPELPELDFGMMIFRMLIFLGIVLVLIYVILKKGLPLLINPSLFRSSSVKILERIPVDQKRSLLVVDIQGKVYLLGSAEGQINILMELDAGKMKPVSADGNSKFDNVLTRLLMKKETKTERV